MISNMRPEIRFSMKLLVYTRLIIPFARSLLPILLKRMAQAVPTRKLKPHRSGLMVFMAKPPAGSSTKRYSSHMEP